jgi:hypothetical protein
MKNQEETKPDSLNQEPAEQEEEDDRMTAKEWLEHSNEIMAILGIKERTFTDAGKCFVMPYKKPK